MGLLSYLACLGNTAKTSLAQHHVTTLRKTAGSEQSTLSGVWLKSEETVAMKTKRADFVAAYLRGRMIVAGGLGHEPSALDTVEAFHPEKKKWERLAPMTFPRCSASSIVIKDRLLVVGGVNQVPSSAHEILFVKEEEVV